MSDLSYIDKLLNRVEVEWKTLDDIAIKISSGGTPSTGVAEYYDGDIPWLRTQEVDFDEIWDTGVKITESGLKNSSAKWIPANCVIIAMYGATVGKIGINKIPMTTNQACANIYLDEKIANYRYVFHFLHSQYGYIKSLGTGSQTNINAGIVKKLQIPIPSLKIQAEIVRILDAFTELTAELTAELVARKLQYAYYREQLIIDSDFEVVKLESIAKIFLGLTYTPTYVDDGVKFISAKNTSKDFLDLTDVKYISEEEYQVSTANAKPKRGDVLFTRVGSNLGHPVVVDTDENLCIFVSLGFIRVDPKKVLNSYIKHWMNTNLFWVQLRKHAHGAAKVNLNTGWLKNFDVLLPSLPEQQRIVTILDKLDTLTTSLTEGLPREIALRQQQYEYYRELLLSFPKPEVTNHD